MQLLERTTRQVNLTPAGKVFLIEAQAVLDRVEQAVQTTRQAASSTAQRLGVAFTDFALHSIVPKVLSIFRDRFPQVELDILEICTEAQVEALQTVQIDVGFLHPPVRADFISSTPQLCANGS